jgi:F-type H+-transporting ATPase subunit alpha
MLKQLQYSPRSMEQEVLIVFVGNQGYLDKLEVEQIKLFERELFSYFASKHADILDEIKTKRELTDELRARLVKAMDQFAEVFAAEHASEKAAAA